MILPVLSIIAFAIAVQSPKRGVNFVLVVGIIYILYLIIKAIA